METLHTSCPGFKCAFTCIVLIWAKVTISEKDQNQETRKVALEADGVLLAVAAGMPVHTDFLHPGLYWLNHNRVSRMRLVS